MRQLKITRQITHRTEESINRYFQEINKYPMITAEEEVDLSIRIRNGDSKALEKLVISNLRFVVSVAKQYQNRGISFPDLINEGNLGLVKAAKRFDETRGFKFISYAVWWIRQSIIQAISNNTRIVRLPLNRLSSINKVARAVPHLEQQYEREPTEDEIAIYLEMSDEELQTLKKYNKRQVSFDKPLFGDDNNEYSLYDMVQSGDIPAPDNSLMEESVETNIKRALKKLSRREADVLCMSYGLNNTPTRTLNDIASSLDLTKERARQIKEKALSKLKLLLEGKYTLF